MTALRRVVLPAFTAISLASGCGVGTTSEAEFVDHYGVRDIDEIPFVGEDMLQGVRAKTSMEAIMARVGVTPSTSRLLSAHFSPTSMSAVIGVKGKEMALDRVHVNVHDTLIDPSPERLDDDDVAGRVFDGNVIPYDRFPAMRLAAAKLLGMTINQVRSLYVERRDKDGDVIVNVSADNLRQNGTVTFSLEGVVLESDGGAPASNTTGTTTTVSGVTTSVTIETSK
ncbi:MAG: hypothetical protein IV100_33345 [Myxococcales bacterium]|nr:hypothetical protein [Myxococcales bacterium]